MTVKELIERLQQLPAAAQDAQVWYPCMRTDEPNPTEEMEVVEAVEYERGSVVLE